MNSTEDFAPAVHSILEASRERAQRCRDRDLEPVSVEPTSLPDALSNAEQEGRTPVIAEVKPTSPTANGTRADDPVALASGMVEGGAAAISVLTEPTHFGGSPEALTRVREAVDVPVLRKDFILDEAQLDVVESDVVLVIVRFVDDVAGLLAAARDRGFQVLVEVHDQDELAVAIDAGADIIGVNNRDLARLEVDLATFERVVPHVPDDVTLLAESGIHTRDHVTRMRDAGADGLLIGSAIMDHDAGGDVTETTRRLTTGAAD